MIADAKTKVYGDADPSLTYQVSGGARRDRTVDLLHAMQALSQLSYSPLLNVIADAKTKVYGDADPSLTYQVSGPLRLVA